MQLDDLITEMRGTALLLQKSFGAALLLWYASIMKSNLKRFASASAAMVRCLPIARQYLASSKVGESRFVGPDFKLNYEP